MVTTVGAGEEYVQCVLMAAAEIEEEREVAARAAHATTQRLVGPTNKYELQRAVFELTGLIVPDKAVCPGHSAPLDALAHAYFADGSMAVWKGSRGLGGKTTLLAALSHLEMIYLGAEVVILGGSGQQSERVHQAQDSFWNYAGAPTSLLARDTTKYETWLTNHGHSIALTASTRSARGPHPSRLRLDEVDEMDLQILDAAMGQTMMQRGVRAQTVMSSTHQYPDGTMSEVLKRAEQRGWRVFEWCYRENLVENAGWLEPSEVERKKNEVTQAMWDAEFELQEPTLEGRAINTQAVERMFDPALGEYSGELGEEQIYEPPMSTGTYATGTDLAKSVDYFINITLKTDLIPVKVVAFKRDGRRPWPTMIADWGARVKLYNNSPCAHDNTGLGTVVTDLLDFDSEPVTFAPKIRAELLTEYITAIEHDEIRAPRVSWMYSEHRYATYNDLYGTGHLPDSIAAGALAYRAFKHGGGSMW